MTDTSTRIRIDKWLWCARFYKTRELAAEACEKGRLRLNGNRVEKPGKELRPGDILTLPVRGKVMVIKVLSGAPRRGPASEAQMLYEVIEE
ncbi:ribosome-associated heat shock protein Hsp15 [Rhizomicrobium palustre]|uniref:Ribosome-associated heat shock protein Hsp15 n=1 Tax=Rhizomicrobium palustre TaxID=189966 RepID=A0A846N366_9PROT|nr:RNA-binding S4 domain-containing protein [Rhizomicrobium palustre]NIK90053.1 ribosome-associated heat shock protein Hsp15 [Rhizomicrobium palustre]